MPRRVVVVRLGKPARRFSLYFTQTTPCAEKKTSLTIDLHFLPTIAIKQNPSVIKLFQEAGVHQGMAMECRQLSYCISLAQIRVPLIYESSLE